MVTRARCQIGQISVKACYRQNTITITITTTTTTSSSIIIIIIIIITTTTTTTTTTDESSSSRCNVTMEEKLTRHATCSTLRQKQVPLRALCLSCPDINFAVSAESCGERRGKLLLRWERSTSSPYSSEGSALWAAFYVWMLPTFYLLHNVA